MTAPYRIDPDQFLDFTSTVAITREDALAAWESAYALAAKKLQELGPEASFYLVFGLQGAGKSTWAAERSKIGPRKAVYFSGPLPSRKHRARAIELAKRAHCRIIGVWINEPLAVALERNSRRTGLARIKEETIRHVFESLEPPSLDEGFHEVIVVSHASSEA